MGPGAGVGQAWSSEPAWRDRLGPCPGYRFCRTAGEGRPVATAEGLGRVVGMEAETCVL